MNKASIGIGYTIVLLFAMGTRVHGEIVISAHLKEKVPPYDQVLSGYADAALSVDFVADANCYSCGCDNPHLEYQWCFGDGDIAYGQNVSHTYGSDGAGNNTAHVHVTCETTWGGCGAFATSRSLSVYAIDDIRVDTIGDISNPTTNGRLCFNSKLDIGGTALPVGVLGSDKIDWYTTVGTAGIARADTASGSLPNLADAHWPASNSSWGAGTMYISIDGPHVAGQEGELRLTGTPSFVSTGPMSIKKFYEAKGKQHPYGYDPWNIKIENNCYYYSQTSAHNGCIFNHNGSECLPTSHPDYPPYIGNLNNPHWVGDYTWYGYGFVNGNRELWGIDVYAWASRHEMKHHNDYTSWWGPGGVDPAFDQDEGWGNGDNIPDSIEGGFAYSQGGPYSSTTRTTHPSGAIGGFDDQAECLFTQEEWAVESLKSIDWAHPGSQWH